MDLKQLGYFLLVSDRGSFSKAALELNMAQPSLSRQIALLEAEFGQVLFIRTGRGVSLTDAGQLLASHARSLIVSARQMADELRGYNQSPSGRITIGIPPRLAFGLGVPLIEMFRSRFPRAVLTLIEGLSIALREQLTNGRLDMALLFDAPATAHIELRSLSREPLLLIGPPGSTLPTNSTLDDLTRYQYVLPSMPNAIRGQVEAALKSRRLTLDVVAEVGAVQTTLALVAARIGHTILPRSALAVDPVGTTLSTSEIRPEIWNTLMLALPENMPATRLVREAAELVELLVRQHMAATMVK